MKVGLIAIDGTSARELARTKLPQLVFADNNLPDMSGEELILHLRKDLGEAMPPIVVLSADAMSSTIARLSSLAIAEYMTKLECALRGRKTPMRIVARTDASPLDEAIRRAQAFHAAGADVTLIDGLRTAGIIDVQTNTGVFQPGGEISLYGGSHGEIQPGFNYGGSDGALNYYVSGDYMTNTLGIESPDGSVDPLHDRTKQ